MGLRRTKFLAAVAVALTLLARPVVGGPIDPLLQFQVIRTEHFVIYFHQGEEHLASRLTEIAEQVRRSHLPHLTPPTDVTHVVLLDQAEEANGWATPLPRDTIFLNAAAPSGSELIGSTEDWLQTVFTHEYTHIVHLDRSRGWARFARAGLGRNPIAFPNLWLPQWQIEGLATYQETMTGFDGRLSAGDFRTLARQDLAHRLSLDRASGGLVGWPSGHAPYAAGLEFHQFLARRFGDPSLGQLADATAGRVPYFSSGAFRNVFGESLGSLWREYERSVKPAGYAASNPAIRQITRQGQVVLAPRFVAGCAGCPSDIVYASRTPNDFPTMRVISDTGEGDRTLTTRYLGATTGVRGDILIFDQQEVHRSIAVLSDLYAYDRRSGEVSRLTYGSRLRDPDVSPDGTRLVAVRGDRGRRDLVVADLSGVASGSREVKLSNIRVLVSEPDTQFSAPRWSPDGRMIAVERRRLTTQSVVAVLDAGSGRTVARWGGGNAVRAVTPTWRPDGRAIVAALSIALDPFDLFELHLDDPSASLRITHTAHSTGPDGAFWPDVSPDGREIAFVGYTSSGYDVFVVPYRAETLTRAFVPGGTEDTAGSYTRPIDPTPPLSRTEPTPPAPYSPLATLLPTSWMPLLISDTYQTRLGGAVSGSDVLGRHGYTVQGSWLTQRGFMTSPLPSGPDWQVSYAYTRWQPAYFGSLSRETQFRRMAATPSTAASTHAAVRHEAQAGVLWPIVRARRTSRALVSIVDTRASDLLDDRTVDARLVGARVAFANDTSRRYGYSISREHGMNVGGTAELTRRALGGTADANTMTVDARGYLPGAARQHVVAVRAAAARSSGDNAARQFFELGVLSASPSVIDFGSSAVGLFRGTIADSNSTTRLVATNIEYRLPLKFIERGYGTLPVMLRTVHASVFVDLLQAQDAGAATRRFEAMGAELSLDAVVGYSLPGAVSVGAAWTMPRRDTKRDVRFYIRLGRAF